MNLYIVCGYHLLMDTLEIFISQKLKDANVNKVDNLQEMLSNSRPASSIIILTRSGIPASETPCTLVGLLKNQNPNTEIIFIEDWPEQKNTTLLHNLLHAGISGYLTIECSSEEFSTCLVSVSNGKKHISSNPLKKFLDSLCSNSKVIHSCPPSTAYKALTDNEMMVASMLTEGISVSKIANKTGRRASTISTIKKNIFRKTKADNIIMLRDYLTANKRHEF